MPARGSSAANSYGTQPNGAHVERQPIKRTRDRSDEGLAGGEEVAIVALLVQQVVHDGPQQLLARLLDGLQREARIDRGVLREGVETFHHEEVAEERPHTVLVERRGDHPIDFATQSRRLVQIAALGRSSTAHRPAPSPTTGSSAATPWSRHRAASGRQSRGSGSALSRMNRKSGDTSIPDNA